MHFIAPAPFKYSRALLIARLASRRLVNVFRLPERGGEGFGQRQEGDNEKRRFRTDYSINGATFHFGLRRDDDFADGFTGILLRGYWMCNMCNN